jgi:hypothetical protein
VVLVDHVANERGLPGEVDVVGPGVDRGLDEGAPVEGVRAYGRDDDAGVAHDGVERGAVSPVAKEQRDGRDPREVGGDGGADRLELLAAPACERPGEGGRAGALLLATGEVLGDELPREAGCPPDDDVEAATLARRDDGDVGGGEGGDHAGTVPGKGRGEEGGAPSASASLVPGLAGHRGEYDGCSAP